MPFPLMGGRMSEDEQPYPLTLSDPITIPVNCPEISADWTRVHSFDSFRQMLWGLEVHQLCGKVVPLVRVGDWTYCLVGGLLVAISDEEDAPMVVKGSYAPQ